MLANLTLPSETPSLVETPSRSSWWTGQGVALLLGLLGIVTLAVVLRLYPLTAGFPQLYRNPEETAHLEAGLRIARGDVNPGWITYPSLRFYLLGIALRLVHGEEVYTDPLGQWSSSFALTSRGLSLVLGVLCVLAMFLAGRALSGNVAGLLAALFTAVDPLQMSINTETSVDASLSLFFALTLWALIRLCQAPSVGRCIVAGIFAGLATSSKQPGLALFPLVALAYGLATWRGFRQPGKITTVAVWSSIALLGILSCVCFVIRSAFVPQLVEGMIATVNLEPEKAKEHLEFGLNFASGFFLRMGILSAIAAVVLATQAWARNLVVRLFLNKAVLLGLACGFVAFLCTSPYTFIQYRSVLRKTLYLTRLADGTGSGDYLTGSSYYLGQLVETRGVLWLTLAGGFAVYMFRRRSVPGILVACAAAVFFLAFTSYAVRFPYYMAPATLAVDLLAAAALASLVPLLRRRYLPWVAWSAACAAVLYFPVHASVSWAQQEVRPDTSVAALEWLRDHLPPGTVVARPALSPQTEIYGNRFQTVYVNYDLELLDWDKLRQQKVQYVVLADNITAGWKAAPRFFHKELARYQWIRDQYPLEKTFEPGGEVKGPTVYVVRVPTTRPVARPTQLSSL
jgi:4-amino-4-deoxy-L-arabinose transferase-like glycosyltransferase